MSNSRIFCIGFMIPALLVGAYYSLCGGSTIASIFNQFAGGALLGIAAVALFGDRK